jgi:hypothetical protein
MVDLRNVDLQHAVGKRTTPRFDPYICIQNPGATDAAVSITYMKGDGTTDTQTLTVGKNSRSTVTVRDKLGTGDDASHDFSAKVECTNGQKIIAERPMYFNYKGIWTGGHDVVGALAPTLPGTLPRVTRAGKGSGRSTMTLFIKDDSKSWLPRFCKRDANQNAFADRCHGILISAQEKNLSTGSKAPRIHFGCTLRFVFLDQMLDLFSDKKSPFGKDLFD